MILCVHFSGVQFTARLDHSLHLGLYCLYKLVTMFPGVPQGSILVQLLFNLHMTLPKSCINIVCVVIVMQTTPDFTFSKQ